MISIAIGSDHAGFARKQQIVQMLEDEGIEYKDFGTLDLDPVDYPDIAIPVSMSVARHECSLGILVCGSGIGMSIVANKVPGVRAALCANEEYARMARLHNNANILCLGGRFMDKETAFRTIKVFISTDFEGGRHEKRVNKIHTLTDR